MPENKPSPGVAAVLSFLFTGLGQLYNGQIKKGLTIIFFSFISMFLIVMGAIAVYYAIAHFFVFKILAFGIISFLIGTILICILGLHSIFDAYKFAKRQ